MKKTELLKILMLGEGWIKKALLSHHINKPQFFEADTSVTIRANFLTKDVEFETLKVKLQLWDFTAGDQFKYLHRAYVIGGLGA